MVFMMIMLFVITVKIVRRECREYELERKIVLKRMEEEKRKSEKVNTNYCRNQNDSYECGFEPGYSYINNDDNNDLAKAYLIYTLW